MPDEVSTCYVLPAAVVGNVGAPLDMGSIESDFHTACERDDDVIYISAEPLAEGLQLV